MGFPSVAKQKPLMNGRPDVPPVLLTISRSDYQAFRRLNDSDLPETHDEWVQVLAELKWQSGRSGHIVEEKRVDPREFVRYCSPRALMPNLNSLLEFTQQKAAGRKY